MSQKTSPLALFARLVAGCSALLLFAGALVTSTGSGLAVPDWPLSFGTLFPPMVGGVAFEHGHRMIAAGVGVLTVILAVWATRARSPVRGWAWAAVGLVVLQGLLGGLTVLMRLPVAVSVAHACTAQAFFCLVVALAVATGPSWESARGGVPSGPTGPPTRAAPGSGGAGVRLSLAALLATGVVFFQLILGATMRHLGAGLVIPDFPLAFGRLIPPYWNGWIAVNFAHRLWALVVLLAVGHLVGLVWRHHRRDPCLFRPALAAGGLVILQVLLGALTVWSGRGVIPTSLHVVNGALLLAACVVLVMWSFRRSGYRAGVALPGVGTARFGKAALRDWLELTKPRLVGMAGFTAAAAYLMGCRGFPGADLFDVVAGVVLMGAGGAALNQVVEVEVDSRMRRTRNRPLPAGRLGVVPAAWFGALLGLGGSVYLGLALNALAGVLAFLALVSYVFVYTPLKRFTCLSILVGAVPGALPVLIGWTAATGGVDSRGWVLFAILYFWQLPHFLAIAWMYREDFGRAGLPVLVLRDPGGRITTGQILLYTLGLLPLSLLPAVEGLAGPAYFASALLLGLGLLYFGLQVARQRTVGRARQLLLATVAYLPLLYLAMVCNRV